MASVMRIDDETRIRILEALLGKNAVRPNLRHIQRLTGFHKATVKSSLDFLEREGLVSGYGPKMDFRKLGYTIEATTLLQADLSKQELLKRFVKRVEEDPHLYWFSGILGGGNWNLMTRHVHEDIEDYRAHFQAWYDESVPGLFDLIKDRQIFFSTQPTYKNVSRTKSVIELIKRKRGLD